MDLSIIILSFNTKDITDRCLSRLQVSVVNCHKKLNNHIEVIVLDNASSDGSLEMIRKKHLWVELIESKENTGFSKGNNIVLKKTSTPYILLLNSDVYVKEETIISAIEYFKDHFSIDVLGCKLTFENERLQPSAGGLPNFINIPFWIFGLGGSFHPKDKSFFSKTKKVGWIMGAFFMFKKEVLEKVGGFDENLFMHMEEVELCKRIKDANFNIYYVPDFSVVHLHGASGTHEKAVVNEIRGIKYYFKKHYPAFYWFIKIILIKGLIFRIIVFSLFGKTKRAKAYWEGLKII